MGSAAKTGIDNDAIENEEDDDEDDNVIVNGWVIKYVKHYTHFQSDIWKYWQTCQANKNKDTCKHFREAGRKRSRLFASVKGGLS